MFFHGGELSLAQAGGGPGLVRQVQPGRYHEMSKKVFPARLIQGGAAPKRTFFSYRKRTLRRLTMAGTDGDEGPILIILSGMVQKSIAPDNLSIIISI
jgi:hypothetical protein